MSIRRSRGGVCFTNVPGLRLSSLSLQQPQSQDLGLPNSVRCSFISNMAGCKEKVTSRNAVDFNPELAHA